MLEMDQVDKQIRKLNENLMEIEKQISSGMNGIDTGVTTSKATQDRKERKRARAESASNITSFLIIVAAVTLLSTLLLLLFNKSIAESDNPVMLPPI